MPRRPRTELHLFDRQVDALETKTPELLVGGDEAQSGKSHLLRVAGIYLCSQHRGVRAALVQRDEPRLRETHLEGRTGLPSLLAHMQFHGAVAFDPKMIEARFANGSTLTWYACAHQSEVNRLLRASFEILLVDDVHELALELYDRLRRKTLTSGGRHCRVIVASGERSPSWVGSRWNGRSAKDRAFVEFRTEDLDPSMVKAAEVDRPWWGDGPEPYPHQQAFHDSDADVRVLGGAAGPGKTFGIVREPLLHLEDPAFQAVCFRRTMPRITQTGGMWDEAMGIYPSFGGVPRQSPHHEFRFPSGARIQFAHLQDSKKTHLEYKGAQIPRIYFDQLEEFTEAQFWYLVSRNRLSSMASFRPGIGATCNPVPDDDRVGGWLNKLLSWWWNPETGYAIPERAGLKRWFVRLGDELRWADDREDLVEELVSRGFEGARAEMLPRSLCFIPADVEDNPHLLERNPEYLAALYSLPPVEQERLLRGNWKIKPAAGKIVDRAWFELVDELPAEMTVFERGWDKAATPGAGCFSSGVKIGWHAGIFYVCGLVRGQWSYGHRNQQMKQTAQLDGRTTQVVVEQEPGSGGKESALESVRQLAGFTVVIERVTGSKVARLGPFISQAQVGNVRVLKADWTEGYLQRLHNFTGAPGESEDDADATSVAFNELTKRTGEWDLA